MSHDTEWKPCVSSPQPTQQQVLKVVQQQSQALSVSARGKVGRPSELPWMQLCLGVVFCVFNRWSSQLDLRRVLCCEGFWEWPAVGLLCDQAIYNRLARAGLPMQRLFEQVSQSLRSRLCPWQDRRVAPFAHQVLALDESILDELKGWLPLCRVPAGQKVPLAGRISALFDVRLQQWVRVDVLQDAQANCKVHARAMLEQVERGALVLFDRGYFAFAWLDELTERGLFWVSRYSNDASYRIRHICYQGDGILDAIVELGVYRSDQTRMVVRLVQFWLKGKQYRYLTNVCDPLTLPLAEVARLYRRRWDIELAFRLLKDHLQFRLLWSARWPVIQVQLWAALLLGQIFHGLQQEIAHQAGVEPEEVSIALLVRMAPGWYQRRIDPVEHSLRLGRELGIIRPSSRTRWVLPLVDPASVTSPPPEALQPRTHARHAHRKGGPRCPSAGATNPLRPPLPLKEAF
ncbi:MAG: IS4 family transposase [Ktedonobacteraceae bacterium]|nr:IS4 family transposase [Ktedonobacteraceae bacterium]